jgi:RNA polymerase sigma-70 factor (ECF subfamily)
MDRNPAEAVPLPAGQLHDEEIAARVLAGESALFEVLMRRHNQRVYRAIRALIRDEAEVEDAMQQTYLSAYLHLAEFAGSARLSTWLVRIAVNEALGRLRRGRRLHALAGELEGTIDMRNPPPASPEAVAERRELSTVLERAVDGLPDIYRTVFMLREIEGLTTAEAAEALAASEDVVKTRLHRARGLLQERLAAIAEERKPELFPFHAPRCDRVVAAVMAAIARGPSPA